MKQVFSTSVAMDRNDSAGHSSPFHFIRSGNPDEVSKHFKVKQQIWDTYLETGEGATALFDCMVMDLDYSTLDSTSRQSVSVAQLKEFLDEIDYKGINGPEWKELEDMERCNEEFDLQGFKTWVRHATHDWSVHV